MGNADYFKGIVLEREKENNPDTITIEIKK